MCKTIQNYRAEFPQISFSIFHRKESHNFELSHTKLSPEKRERKDTEKISLNFPGTISKLKNQQSVK